MDTPVHKVDAGPAGFALHEGATSPDAAHYHRKGPEGWTDYLVRSAEGYQAFRFRFHEGEASTYASEEGLTLSDALAWFDA